MSSKSDSQARLAALREHVSSWLGTRAETIDRHGFKISDSRVAWWNRELAEAGLGSLQVATQDVNGVPMLTRAVLFGLADGLVDDADDETYLNVLWHALIWGSGKSERLNRRRIQAFGDPGLRAERVGTLRESARLARAGKREDAYRTLIRRGGGKVPGLGPAFFTKFLYFASMGRTESPCLILDARVATVLHDAGWAELPKGSFNWYTTQYVSYCDLLDAWAAEQSAVRETAVRPDEIERALFDGVRRESAKSDLGD